MFKTRVTQTVLQIEKKTLFCENFMRLKQILLNRLSKKVVKIYMFVDISNFFTVIAMFFDASQKSWVYYMVRKLMTSTNLACNVALEQDAGILEKTLIEQFFSLNKEMSCLMLTVSGGPIKIKGLK